MADIIVILDESGSMLGMGLEPVQAMNAFIEEQKKTAGDSLFSLYTFSNNVRRVHFNVPLREMKEYSDYHPSNFTALFDCILQAIDDKMADGPKKNVVLVIITDGEDNSSRHGLAEVKQKIKSQETEHNWQIIYLAANQDAFGVGQGLNIQKGKISSYNQGERGSLADLVRQVSTPISVYRQQSSQVEGKPSSIDMSGIKRQD